MSQEPSLRTILEQAGEHEKKYNWLEARDRYERARGGVDEKGFVEKGELQEKIGYCLHRAAFQAESREEFKERMGEAIEAYAEAQALYEKSGSDEKSARIDRCGAVAKYLGYWIERCPDERLRLLDECLELESRALTAFWNAGNKLEYGRMYGLLPLVFPGRLALGWDREAEKRIIDEGIEWGQRAVSVLSELGEPHETAKAYLVLATCLQQLPSRFTEEPPPGIIQYLGKASELLQDSGDAQLLGLLHYRWTLGGVEEGSQDALTHCEKALECGAESRDNFLKGVALSGLIHHRAWRTYTIETDPDERTRQSEEEKELLDRAVRLCSIVPLYGFGYVFMQPPWGHVDFYFFRGMWETDLDKKREFLNKAVEIGSKALREAEEYEINFTSLLRYLSYSVWGLSVLESDLQRKRRMTETGLKYNETVLERVTRRFPLDYWGIYTELSATGRWKALLADLEPDLGAKTRLYEEAAKGMVRALELAYKQPLPVVRRVHVAFREMLYSGFLTRLYLLTKDSEHLRKAVEVSQRAAESCRIAGLASRAAECYWEMAKSQALLREYVKASESFQEASDSYTEAAESVPQLRDFYRDHAIYMQAWSETEKAKQFHGVKEYGAAKGSYERVSALHESTRRWNHLSLSYLAWARLEEAEDQSRREQTQEARDLFQQAGELFSDVRESLKEKLRAIGPPEDELRSEVSFQLMTIEIPEKQLVEDLIQASELRRGYCLARVLLEEAKLLDKQGDHAASSERYGLAAEGFERVATAMELESERRELASTVFLCRAWQRMTAAEAQTSPKLFLEASEFFDKARDHEPDEKSRLLDFGHSSFCRALEAGAMYERTQDEQHYSAAKRHVETATNFYVRAGFKEASEYAKATNRLFDAYSYMYQGQLERDLTKKAQLYQLAEKLLQNSAGFYVTAKHPEKNDEVLRVLESVRQERETAVSLTEVLHAPAITSTTASFSTPSQSREQAVGLERFENADVQASVMPRDQEAKLGDTVSLKIELVNAGKGGAQLIRVAELVPARFELVEKPEMYNVEDSGLNMKGKSLGPLRTEELSLVLKPLDKGSFQIKPRIIYLDEAGKYKYHEPEPVIIVVKELGILGSLKGPSRDK